MMIQEDKRIYGEKVSLILSFLKTLWNATESYRDIVGQNIQNKSVFITLSKNEFTKNYHVVDFYPVAFDCISQIEVHNGEGLKADLGTDNSVAVTFQANDSCQQDKYYIDINNLPFNDENVEIFDSKDRTLDKNLNYVDINKFFFKHLENKHFILIHRTKDKKNNQTSFKIQFSSKKNFADLISRNRNAIRYEYYRNIYGKNVKTIKNNLDIKKLESISDANWFLSPEEVKNYSDNTWIGDQQIRDIFGFLEGKPVSVIELKYSCQENKKLTEELKPVFNLGGFKITEANISLPDCHWDGIERYVIQQWQGAHTNSVELRENDSNQGNLIFKWKDLIGEYQEKINTLTSRHLSKKKDLPFIDLGLIERKKEKKPVVDTINRDGSLNGEREVEIVKNYASKQFFQEVLQESITPKKQGKIIIIGEPGAGKTTLLQQISKEIINEDWGCPIWVSLKELEARNSPEKLLDFIYNRWLSQVLKESANTKSGEETFTSAKESLRNLFKREKIWLLLDGLDEMTIGGVKSAFSEIQQQINSLKELNPHRIVLSCRQNLWNSSDSNRLEGFDAFYTQKFSNEQVKEFIHNWFLDSDLAGELIKELAEPKNQNINYLITNPLLLTMLCVVYEKGTGRAENQLPGNRAKLYEGFVPLYYDWKKEEFGIAQHDRDILERQILPRVALWGLENISSRYVLSEKELKDCLQAECDIPLENVAYWCEKLENTWIQKIGVDSQNIARSVYSFFHPTFQEYFASLAVDDYDYFLPKEHINRPVAGKEYRIFEDKWREIILFWIGRGEIEKEEKESLMKALWEFEDGMNLEFYQQYPDKALLLAGYCTGEFESELGYEICKKICLNDIYEKDIPFLNRQDAISALIEIYRDKTLNNFIRCRAIWGLSKIALSDDNVIYTLTDSLLDRTFNPLIRSSMSRTILYFHIDPRHTIFPSPLNFKSDFMAAGSLRKIAFGRDKAINDLIDFLHDETVDVQIRENAAGSLGKVAFGRDKTINALINFLRDETVDVRIRESVAGSLETIAFGFDTAINPLIDFLRDKTVDSLLRGMTTIILGKIAHGHDKTINALIDILHDETVDSLLLQNAAKSLGKIAHGHDKAINALIDILHDEKLDSWVRKDVFESLEKIATGNKFVFSAFIEFMTVDEKTLKNAVCDTRNIAIWNIVKTNTFTYPRLFEIYHSYTPQNQQKLVTDNSLALQQTESIHPLLLNLTSLSGETNKTIITQEIINQIYHQYQTKLADYLEQSIPDNIDNWSKLKTKIVNLKQKLPQKNLAMIIEECDPNEELIDILNRLTDTVHICLIADTEFDIKNLTAISPQSPNLQSAIDNWLERIANS